MAESASRTFTTEAKELADAGQFGEAIKILQQGLKNFPKMMSARVLLGEIYWMSGDVSLARAELEQVTKIAPDNFAAHRKLAMIYRDLGDRHAAAHACIAVLQANPRDREMKDVLEELLGGPKEAQAKAPDAHAEEEPVLPMETEAEETDSEALAELYIVQGYREKGLAVYRRLVEKDPDNMTLHERIMALEEGETLQEAPAQVLRKARIRRLEGWLSVIRERRRS